MSVFDYWHSQIVRNGKFFKTKNANYWQVGKGRYTYTASSHLFSDGETMKFISVRRLIKIRHKLVIMNESIFCPEIMRALYRLY